MKEITTCEYPTRYIAFENQKTLVIQRNFISEGGYEYAVYSYRVRNSYWPNLIDGLYASVESYQGKEYLIQVSLTLPNKERRQLGFSKVVDDYQEALSILKEGIQKYEEILNKEVMQS